MCAPDESPARTIDAGSTCSSPAWLATKPSAAFTCSRLRPAIPCKSPYIPTVELISRSSCVSDATRNLLRTSRPLSGRAPRHKSGFLINQKRELTSLPVLRYSSGHRKGRLKILSVALSYVEVHWLLAVIAAVMFLGSFVLKRNEPGKGGHVAVH